ncbi:unnamed protein product [Linum tenue]|uniref:Nodulin-like domain-containing protein n=1 Tax=Linum tenue TaxID=586396 RepID=A0AAV0IR70_9ROSI|nr:unnamed protein product [Linum tenue]
MPPPPTSAATLQWLSLVAIIWLQSVNGTNTTFPAYSSQLKNLLSLSQLQLNNLAFASDAGKLFGFISGFAALHLPLPLVLLAGSLLGLAGYGAQYLFLTGTIITSLSYPQIFLLTVLAGNSICWINTVCYVVAVRNFPAANQPLTVGISTAYQGLSAKIYTVFAAAVFPAASKNPAEAYLLLSSLLPLLVTTFTAPLLRDGGAEREMEGGGVVAIFLVTIATGVYSVVSSLTFFPMSPSRGAVGISAFLLAPLAVPIVIKLRRELNVAGKKKGSTRIYTMNYGEEIDIGRVENGVAEGTRGGGEGGEAKLPMEMAVTAISDEGKSGGENKEGFVGVGVMVKRVEFWVYFGAYLCGPTIGLVFLNNLGQIAESRGELRTASLVALSSSFGFFGRLVPSFLDYFLARSRCKISRPASIAALMAPMAAAFFLLVINTTASFNHVALYVSTAVIGVCTGAITSISVSTTSDLFGTANFSLNHNIVVANIPLGSFAFGYLAAFFYHREGGGGGKCMGMLCYRDTFVIWGSLCGFGTLLALVLHARTRKLYSQTVLAT